MHGQSITLCRWRSAVSPFCCSWSQHCMYVADGVSRKTFLVFLATYLNAHLKNQYPFSCTLNQGFFTALVCCQRAIHFGCKFFLIVVPPYITTRDGQLKKFPWLIIKKINNQLSVNNYFYIKNANGRKYKTQRVCQDGMWYAGSIKLIRSGKPLPSTILMGSISVSISLQISWVIFSVHCASQLLRAQSEVMLGWEVDALMLTRVGWTLFKWYIIGVIVVLYLYTDSQCLRWTSSFF